MSGEDELFRDLPEQNAPQAPARGAPRLRHPERNQVRIEVAALDDLVPDDHPVREVWGFAQGLDLSELEEAVKSREGAAGHPAAAPVLMVALWLWATVEGVGSARQLDKLCKENVIYRWLCGGVSMNPHSLSDFRVAHSALLDRLLAESVTALIAEGLVKLDLLAQDGIKVRAAAGAKSFRRGARLELLREAADERVRQLRAELEGDTTAGDKRQRRARERGAREKAERIAAAGKRMQELEAERKRREKTNKAEVAKQKEPRASTTDPEARVMKMADGGFRPAYNMQLVSAPVEQVIVAVDVETSGSDRGLAKPTLEALRTEGIDPSDYLVDGGFTKNDDIEWGYANDVRLWCPPTQSKHGTDPYAPRDDDGPGVADWRRRMASEAGKALYKERAKAECPNAWGRRMGLDRLLVRGKEKARAVLLWFALAQNMLRGFNLRRAAALAAVAA
ncbi:MAG TPA: IS1182 family transposase [Burkholderiaceae bacterium]|nr:IS1182 family transposase [Burkholderiaceae bacterium]